MAYGLRYVCEFLNYQNQKGRLELYAKDYYGSSQALLGSEKVFVIQKEIENPFEPVQATVAQIELLSDEQTEFNLNSFYSEDDEYWMVKFYLLPLGGTQRNVFFTGSDTSTNYQHSVSENSIIFGNQTSDHNIIAGQQMVLEGRTYDIVGVSYSQTQQNLEIIVQQTVTAHFVNTLVSFVIYDIADDGLKFTGFLLQEESSESFVGFDHYIQLTASDHLGLLSDITFSDVYTGSNIYSKLSILDYLKFILPATGLRLPLQAFTNIAENSTLDRSDSSTATFLDQIVIYSGRFAKEDGSWLSCFEILSELMEDFNCVLCQRKGKWTIYRWGEFSISGGAVPGTEYTADFLTKTPVSLSLQPITLSDTQPNSLIGAEGNLIKHLRPYLFTEEVFNYEQPASLLKDSDLQELGTFIRTYNQTINNVIYRFDEYNFPPYFRHENSAPNGSGIDQNFIRVITSVVPDGNGNNRETETERYIVTPFVNHEYKWLSFAPIEVSAQDTFDFSCSFKALDDSDKPLRVNFRFELFYNDNGTTKAYSLAPFGVNDNIFGKIHWISILPANYKANNGIPYDVSTQITDYNNFSLSGIMPADWHLPPFPVDGILMIAIDGANTTTNNGSLAEKDVATKDFTLTMYNRINESYDISGQTHTQQQILPSGQTIKNSSTRDRNIDDSPRNSIAGTLFVNQSTHFDYISVDAYMKKTLSWHRFNRNEALRLGQITTLELKQVYDALRYSLDCSIFFLDSIDFMTVFHLPSLGLSNLMFGQIGSMNYKTCTIECTLVEVWQDNELSVNSKYDFEYTFKKS